VRLKVGVERTDAWGVRLMRLRLSMKLGGLAAMLVMTVFGARACEGAGSGSGPAGSPAQFLQSGLAGVCADAAADAAAGSPVSLTVPADPALGLTAGAPVCGQPTTSTTP
jgi:hypothetical protein